MNQQDRKAGHSASLEMAVQIQSWLALLLRGAGLTEGFPLLGVQNFWGLLKLCNFST
jgi:hypothetical protein